MELIQWRDEFRIGIPEIDHDHEELIKEINDLWKAAAVKKQQQTIKEFLGKVYDRVASHFSREEAIMQARHYDQYSEHKAEHESLLEEILDIEKDCAEGYNDYDPEGMLGRRVSAWFTDHVRIYDARLRKLMG